MARRSKDWNEGLATDLQDPDFARAFLLAAIDEGLPIQQVLAKVIRTGESVRGQSDLQRDPERG